MPRNRTGRLSRFCYTSSELYYITKCLTIQRRGEISIPMQFWVVFKFALAPRNCRIRGNIILFKFAPSPRNGQIREGELPIFSKFPFFSLRHLVIQIFGTFSAFGHFSEPVVHRGGSFARYVHCLFNRKLFIRRPYYLFSVGVGGGKLFFTGGHVE